MSFLSLTEQDRDQMLAAIGVDSVDDLFEQIPPGVRLGRPLELEPPLSVSIGVANYPAEVSTLEELLSAADRALYANKLATETKL